MLKEIGKIVCEARNDFAKARQINDPNLTKPWEQLSFEQRQADQAIGAAIAQTILASVTSRVESITLALAKSDDQNVLATIKPTHELNDLAVEPEVREMIQEFIGGMKPELKQLVLQHSTTIENEDLRKVFQPTNQ